MNKKTFKNPKISINKVYTKNGDSGSTFLIGGKKVKKYSSRVCAFGEIDQLNVYIGLCCSNDNLRASRAIACSIFKTSKV